MSVDTVFFNDTSNPAGVSLYNSTDTEPIEQQDEEILSSSAPTKTIDFQLEEGAKKMIAQLSKKEIEIAARTSFQFLQKRKLHDYDISEELGSKFLSLEQERMALVEEMAKRYLRSKKDPDVALKKMKKTLEFREKIDIDGLRLAFYDEKMEKEKAELIMKTRASLEQRLLKRSHFVQGYDKAGHATYIFIPRNITEHDLEWSLKEVLYTLERAISCSKSNDKTINIIIDFSGFSFSKNNPPVDIGKKCLLLFRDHYVGQIHRIFILNAPAGFALLWNLFKHFIGKDTTKKIKFVSGSKQKRNVMSKWYSTNEATSWMIPEKGCKNRNFDVKEYLYKTPFDRAFDDE